MTPEEILDTCRTQAVRLVRFLYCDNGGVIRGKATHVERLGDRIRTGIGLTVAMQAMNSLDQLQPVEGMGPVGEIRLVPDPETFTVLPYAPHTAAMLADHVRLDGQPYEAGPRNFLKRMAARLAERGMVLSCAVENEWSLASQRDGRYVPVDESLCFSTVGMAASAEVTDATVVALGEQGIQVEQYYAELGHGQQELSVAPLAPKPWPDQAGNGAHIHFSLWDGDGQRNLFHDPAGRFGLSRTAEQFVAGVLTHVPGLLALTAPSVNSYHRLLPKHWSSAFVCWGPDNREATVRVPSTFWGLEEPSTNLEFKPSDASCNPYIAFAGLVAAGLDGIEHALGLPEPMLVDPATLTAGERERAGAARYPETLDEALDALERDEVLTTAMGGPLTASYVAVRRSEFEAYEAMDEAEQFRGHFAKY